MIGDRHQRYGWLKINRTHGKSNGFSPCSTVISVDRWAGAFGDSGELVIAQLVDCWFYVLSIGQEAV
jgi:hypothetical protein